MMPILVKGDDVRSVEQRPMFIMASYDWHRSHWVKEALNPHAIHLVNHYPVDKC